YSAEDLPAIVGHSTPELPPDRRRAVVHRDDLVLM
ncbi:MAG: hypothetical protein JWN61_3061, partial [Pseudonocardiales bacterium]|nr:hypothetical protein [Pseudonocardiales bacterium]